MHLSVIHGREDGLFYSPKAPLVITTSTLALCNACELLALIFTTFKHHHGLHFWILLLTTLGVFPYALGWLLGYLDILGTVDILQTSLGNKQKTMWYHLIISLLIVAMDIALLIIMYKDHCTIEQGVKLVIYSIKLKLEFAVLGKLVDVAQSRGGSSVSETHPARFITREHGRSDNLPEIVHLENTAARRMADDEESMRHLYDYAIKQIYKG
ncbi:hypothetical protein FMUND_4448 [Fusarium mundagurra]|uniref:Uncharacterized protein n=1 Tax=Fusarium mundagurra TaxID=1567541 RepID=A0A8H6DLU5_9HYPO|nr:hypothetical protein FMUND_4448 [Fusarium mundagurra]